MPPLFLSTPSAEAGLYLRKADVPGILRDLPCPAVGSDVDREDLRAVLEIQSKRSPNDCARAESEINATAEAFFGHRSILSDTELEAVLPLLERASHDIDEAVWELKQKTRRVRPHLRSISTQDSPTGKTTPCPGVPPNYNPGTSFPSGHAAIAYIQGLVLSELFPDKRQVILKRAEEVGMDRVVLGVHHPSDIRAGIEISRRAFEVLVKNREFRADLRKARTALSSLERDY